MMKKLVRFGALVAMLFGLGLSGCSFLNGSSSNGVSPPVEPVDEVNGNNSAERIRVFSPTLETNIKRVALVIGNEDYKYMNGLNSPKEDAEDITKKLQGFGFSVIHATDTTKTGMEVAIGKFKKAISKFNADESRKGEGLFYYSGHGAQDDNGINYLIPTDAKSVSAKKLGNVAVALDRVVDVMQLANNNEANIIILDACRSNPSSDAKGIAPGLADIGEIGRSMLVAYATNPGKTANDLPGNRNSVYTKHLLGFLDKPELPIDQILEDVRNAVKQETDGKQVPWHGSTMVTDFIFKPY